MILTTSRNRFHDATDTGALGDPSSTSGTAKARVSYTAAYYDAAGRLMASVDVGTNGGSAYTRPSTVPTRSDTVLVTRTDRNGNVHTYTYDVLGRLTVDAVTTLGSGVDGAVRRVEYAYDSLGNVALVTSYDATSSGNITSQVKRAYNGLGQLVTEWQSHSGAVNTSTTPKVEYAYTEMASGPNHSRLTSVTYPSGYVLTFNYASGLDASISRLSSLSDSGGTLESYEYLGLGTVVQRTLGQPGVTVGVIAGGTGDGGDQYSGLDRFGRVTDLKAVKTSTSTTLSEFQYGYDRAGNRLWRDDLVNTGFGELYEYDGLSQLIGFDRGTLNGTKTELTGSAARTTDWDYDALGNFSGVDLNWTTTTRTHNAQNEVTGVGSNTLTYDSNGNLTTDETGRQFVYDAWNRLVKVKNSGGTLLKTYGYDGLGRRVTDTPNGGGTTDLYYSDSWQVLEQRVSGTITARYVWSPVYVDALILRDRDTDTNGSLDERLYAVQDANWNVVALVDTAGAVVERYVYDPYGVRTVLTPAYGARASSSYVWTVGFQGMSFDSVAGLSHQRARWYSPTLGRWVTMDPMGYGAGDVNLYRAMENKLTTRLDPSGLAPFAAEISVSNIEEAPIQVLDYGKHMWPVRFRLKKPSDKDKGGWVIQHVVREVKIDYPAVEKKLSGKVDYWEAWRVEPNKTGPEPRELVPEALEYLSRLKLDFDGVAANDWYGLTRQVTAPYGQSRGSYTIIGKLYYIDCMGAGDLPSSWKVFNGDPKAGGVKSAGTLRSIHDQEVKSDPASKELMSIIDKAKPVDHILMVSWKMNGKTTIDKKVP